MIDKLGTLIFAFSELYHIITVNEFMKGHLEKRKVNKRYSIIIWSIFATIINIIGMFSTDQLVNILAMIILIFIACHILYSGSIKNKIVIIIFICILGAAMEMIIACGIYIFPNNQNIHMDNNQTYILFGSVSSKILMYLAVKVINKISGQHKVNTSLNYWISLLVVSFGSIYIIYVITIANLKIIDIAFRIESMLLFIIVILINILTFYMYDRMLEETEKNMKNVLYEQQAQYYAKQYEERESLEREIRKIRHNIKNHYICLKKYAKEKDLEGLIRYLDGLIKYTPIEYGKANSGNIAIDALINYKMSYSNQYNIQFDVNLEIPKTLGIDQTTLCIVLGNALDNAIDACKKTTSKVPRIKVYMKYTNGNLYINISNPHIEKISRDKEGKIITTKEDKKRHGLGLESIQNAIEQYNGSLEIEENDDLFKLSILIYSSN